MPSNSLASLLKFFLAAGLSLSQSLAHTVILDPGHGGADAGATKGGVSEKDVTLDLSLRTEQVLHSYGIDTVLTRDRDVFVPLAKRSSLARHFPGAIFVSIHCNSSPRPQSHGIEGYTTTSAGATLSDSVLGRLSSRTGLVNRGTHYRGFRVVRGNASAVSILLEVGFLNNPQENQLLRSSEFRQVQATAIAQGILDYFRAKPALAYVEPPEQPTRYAFQPVRYWYVSAPSRPSPWPRRWDM